MNLSIKLTLKLYIFKTGTMAYIYIQGDEILTLKIDV